MWVKKSSRLNVAYRWWESGKKYDVSHVFKPFPIRITRLGVLRREKRTFHAGENSELIVRSTKQMGNT